MTDQSGTRTVTSRWEGGMRAVAAMDSYEVVTDEHPSMAGTGEAAQPTDLLLASVATCFTLAMAWAAHKRGLELPGLEVEATGTYAGLSFGAIELLVTWDGPANVVEELMPAARRVCYITNTLRNPPALTLVAKDGNPSPHDT